MSSLRTAAPLPIADHPAFLTALPGPFARAIRVHPRRGAVTGWGTLTPVPWSASGFIHDADLDPGTRLDYHTGVAYPQDAASQTPVLMLAPQPGEVVVDACAAPGSKSSQIGLAMGDEGLLVCLDSSPDRRRILAENLARQGVVTAVVTPMPLDRLAQAHPAVADAVLVDAPCSGHEPRSERQLARMAQRQLAILTQAAALVRPGGRLVYSTCTPWPVENESVIRAFLASAKGWLVEPVTLPGTDTDLEGLGAIRLWPQRQGTEPFFACRLRAPGDDLASGSLVGRRPVDHCPPPDPAWLGLTTWRRGQLTFAASAAASACALPSEARGLILGRSSGDDPHDRSAPWRWDPWGAQATIARGANTHTLSHADACRLWAGEVLAEVPDGFLRSAAGAPLGIAMHGRLLMPSRMCRTGLR